MSPSILIIGGTSVDTIIQLDQLPAPEPRTIWPRTSYRALGSTGAGKALNLAALDLTVQLHTLLGADAEGRFVREALAHPNIELLAEEVSEPTEQHVNLMDPEGRRISLFTRPPADPARVDWRPVTAALAGCDLAVINILSYAKPALELAKAAGKAIWTDLHDYDGRNPYHQPFVDAADVIFLSSDNLPDYRSFMTAMIARGKQQVICTHGSQGASLLTRSGDWFEQPAFKVARVCDSNGAGDAFFSGFLLGTLTGADEQTCLRMGAVCGALCVQEPSLAAPALSRSSLTQQWPAE